MSAILLARIQFAFSISFHFLFPATTLGFTFLIFITETTYVISRKTHFRLLTDYLVRILAIVYVMGVVTGAVMEFSFGTNWSRFSRFTGDVFGTPVVAEAISAFAIEAIFLSILIFGRGGVKEWIFWLAALMVFIGSHLSAFWILSANSWMQTPAGFILEGDKLILSSFWKAVLNHSTLIRLCHTILAGWVTGAVVGASIASWHVRRNTSTVLALSLLKISTGLLTILPLCQLLLGHFSAQMVSDFQPAKSAAMEGTFFTQTNAPIYLFGIPVPESNKVHFGIAIPGLLSFLETFSYEGKVVGLNEFPRDQWPPVTTVFLSFHLMVVIGFILIGTGIIGAVLLILGKLEQTQWFLIMLPFLTPLPYICNQVGWMTAEIGRQPWIVYGILSTSEASSPMISIQEMLLSLGLFTLIYTFLFIITLRKILRVIRRFDKTDKDF
jgi:cytochrome d ubiquinol oxidase subunit I